jgi:hypothetical protein
MLRAEGECACVAQMARAKIRGRGWPSPSMLRAEGECACVAQLARAKIRRRGWPSPSLRARHLWAMRTLGMHRGRPLTCGTRSSMKAEHEVPFTLGVDTRHKVWVSFCVAIARLRLSVMWRARGEYAHAKDWTGNTAHFLISRTLFMSFTWPVLVGRVREWGCVA